MQASARIPSAPEAELVPAWLEGRLQPLEKLWVHQQGLKHKAVSVFIWNNGRLLVQQRALGKYHSAGLWANSCCTHPLWGESDADCAARRLAQELGIVGVALSPAGRVEYRADVGSGLIEHEDVALFVGHVEGEIALALDPDEVAATRWLTLAELEAELAQHPEQFTAWLRIYFQEHRERWIG